MPLLEWTDRLSIGIEGIDDQHKKLVRMINEAYEATFLAQNHKEADRLIKAMREYALEHFAAEEYLMKGIGYPDMESHCREHAMFTDQLLSFSADEEPVQAEEVFAFLREWLLTHIMGTDKKLEPYLRNE